jgi:hypothetical protein
MRATLAALALVFSVAACSDLTGPGTLTGTYDLQRVDGRTLPYVTAQSVGYREELIGSSLRLDRDGYYETTFTYRYVIDGRSSVEQRAYSGTYERDGSDLWLYDDRSNEEYYAYWERDRVIVTSDGIEYEYR